MKAAVIGINGYLGQHMGLYLMQQGWEVHGYGRKDKPLVTVTRYSVLDLTDKKSFLEFDIDVDFIFYFSGITGTFKAYSDYEAFIDINEKGLLHLLNEMKEKKSSARVVFPSTRLVYKGIDSNAIKEDDEKEFKSIYALTKWFGENVLQQYATYFNIPFTIYRICVPYGNLFNSDYSYGTIDFFLSKARDKKNISLYGDGGLKRTFTHIVDICAQIGQSVVKVESYNNIYNIGGETYSLREVAAKIADQYSIGLDYTDWPAADALIESGDTIFDSSKIEQLLKYHPQYNFEGWLKDLR